jgi:hypothetical protein
MRHKYETYHYLTLFCAMVKTQFKCTVQQVRSDHGFEFISNPMQTYFQQNGIVHQLSCVNTPQQNGVVECKHRHLLEVARALRFQAHLPISFWGECILTAAYLINYTPTPLLLGKTPYELLFHSSPSYSHIRVFGCLCYAHDHPKHRDKFGSRAQRCVFIGYPFGQKGYRVFNLTTKRIFTSRDVHFHETQFPFQMSSSYPISSAHPVVPLPVSDDPLSHPPSIDHTNTSPPSTEPNFDPTLVSTSVILTEPPPCRLTRDRHCLAYLTDYVCPTLQVPTNSPSSLQEASLGNSSGNPYPLTNFVSYSRYNSPHMAFLTALTSHDEPKTYSQAVRDPRWREAMSKEITAFEHNNTWTLEPLPPGKKPIGCKWIYKVKYHANGTIKCFKACLVAKGYTQVEGLDFHETYAPVAKLVTVRCLLAIAAVKHWELHQLDVHNAFLHGDLHEEVFMTVPPSFAKPGDNRLCRLRKSLYGLKQALRQWFAKFSTALLKFGFQQSTADHSLYTMHKDSAFLAVLVYVDDLIATGNDSTLCCSLKKYLDDCFHIKDLGSLKYFLGIEVARSPIGISLCQRKYTLDILNESDMLGAKPISFPMEQHHHLSIDTGAPVEDPAQYRHLVGRLIYLTITRPDITYSVHIFSQFMHDPHQGHLDVAMRVFRYLKSSPGQGIFLSSSSDLTLQAYCDSDWAGCPMTRRSTTGYFTQLGSSPLSWKTKKAGNCLTLFC